MKITILPREQTITVDGETLAFAFPQDLNVLSIRWDGDNGYIERINGKRLDAQWANVQPYLDLFNAEQARAPTADELIKKYEGALDAHLDAAAKAHRYDNRFTFALRAGYPGPYHDEAVAFAAWMDACNSQSYALMASVLAGTAQQPTIDAFIAGLPEFIS